MKRAPSRRIYLVFGLAFALLLIACIGVYTLIERNILPVIITLAEGRIQTLAVKAMNSAVSQTMNDPLLFSDLVLFVAAEDGTVAMVQANTALINELSTRISQAAQDNLAQMGEQGIQIPLGSVMGSQLLSGRGPKINVKIIPVGTVSNSFRTEFENSGINQTRHKIIMNATATVRLVLPGNNSRTLQVSTEIPLSESIIIGKVPNSYVNVDSPEDLTYPQTFETN